MNYTMYGEVDVFISNYTLLDPEVYQLWIDGCSSSEAVKQLHKRGVTQETGASYDLLSSDVADHYRTYSLLERLLHNPPKLAEQISFQLQHETKQFLIERYYEFDDVVIRELLGKKLSSRHRKDLDEVSDKTKVLLKSCRRQFDNVKRVYKTVEEMQGSVVTNIQNNFLLSQDLAEKYGAVVFIGCMRFETGKRKLQYLTFSDFLHCARVLMDKWTYRCNRDPDGPAMDDTDLDREFLLDMRDLRILLEKEKEHKHLVCQKLKPQLLERSYAELELSFRTYTRALVGMACGLHRGRERVRSFFLDMVERCVEPWKQVAWSRVDLSHFLEAYTQSALEMDVLREVELKNAWERYMVVMTSCLLRLFHS